ncbi:MAG: hypothetical protein IPN69_18780 [Acidobacteria bacterium]|nr:hypothetical protein [Acidobacteriota bacterium]MBK8812758.1 hypothetical protein [Acidobacteriota bacterium]
MAAINYRRSVIAFLAGSLALLMNWLILGNPPPFDFPIDSVAIIWIALSLPIYLFLMALGLPEYLGEPLAKILVFLQWALIAWLADVLVCLISRWFTRR